MQVMSKFMIGDAAKDMFKERVRAIMYKTLGLFFHLRAFSHSSQRLDDHLANIVSSRILITVD